MKILTNKQINYILRIIADCQLIAKCEIEDTEAFCEMTDDLADIAVRIGGPDGASKVAMHYHNKRRNNNG